MYIARLYYHDGFRHYDRLLYHTTKYHDYPKLQNIVIHLLQLQSQQLLELLFIVLVIVVIATVFL